jgi:hypothetical protein
MIVTGPDTAAVIALNAIGQQDTYLTRSDPEHSFFKYEAKQHANFTKFHRSTQVTNPFGPTWPFGQTVKVTLNPRNMGDLLSNMYVYIKFPGLSADSHLADQLGRHLIKSVTMRVDELVVEEYHDDWGIIYDELYLDASEKRTKRYTINRNLAEDTSLLTGNQVLAQFDSELMIPIPLFFSRKYEGDEYSTNNPNRPYFPVCAVHKQKIEFDIVFRPKTFFTNTPDTLSLDFFDIITEEMTVSHEERTYLMTQRQIFVTDVVKKHPSTQTIVGDDTVKLGLVPDIPVKTLNWFLRDADFEDETAFTGGTELISNAFANRFNFSSNTQFSTINSFFEPVLESAKIFVKGQQLPNIPIADHMFFKYIVPFNSRLSRPTRNIYTYTFSMNPINVEPSGSLDFGQLQSNKTLLDIKLKSGLTKVYTLHIYYVGYQTFVFDQGFMSLAY